MKLITQEIMEQIVEARDNGETYPSIAKRYGFSKSRVSENYWKFKAGMWSPEHKGRYTKEQVDYIVEQVNNGVSCNELVELYAKKFGHERNRATLYAKMTSLEISGEITCKPVDLRCKPKTHKTVLVPCYRTSTISEVQVCQ
jgi:hypothetical protein